MNETVKRRGLEFDEKEELRQVITMEARNNSALLPK